MEINKNRIALIVSVESNTNNINLTTKTVKVRRNYEDEAIKCFSAWRKHGGWLKDIPIYCICPSKNIISKKTQDIFKSLNIIYVQYIDDNLSLYSSGFLTLPFITQLFESKIDIEQDILIKIDLDMYLLKEIPESIFNDVDQFTIVGQYDRYSIKDQRSTFEEFLPFDTGLVITNKNNGFGDLWYKLCFSTQITSSKEWKFTQSKFGEYYLEEFVVDYIYYNNLFKLKPIQRYQIGEGYASIDTFSDNEIANILFIHEHIYEFKSNLITSEYNSVYERTQYIKRMQRFYDDI